MNEKRILVCNEAVAAGGIGTYTRTLVEGLQASGWEVGLVTTHGPGEHFAHISERANYACDLSELPLGYGKIRKLEHALTHYSPSILLLNHCSLVHYLLPRLPRHVRPVAVLHSDSPLYYETAALFQHRVFRWIAPAAKLGTAMRRYLPGAASSRIRTIHHGIAPRGSAVRSRRPSIAFIGNVGYNKGVDLLPAIFEQIAAKVPDVLFKIIGDGEDRAGLEANLLHRRLPAEFLGRLEPDDARARLAECDLLLLPTRGEGFGLVIAEAMMAGVVPVVTCLPGVTDTLIDHNRTGILVVPEDADAFAQSATDLLRDSARRIALAQAASESAARQFSLARMIDEYEALFWEPDDRLGPPLRGRLTWGLEVGCELLKRDQDGSRRVDKKLRNMLQARSTR